MLWTLLFVLLVLAILAGPERIERGAKRRKKGRH